MKLSLQRPSVIPFFIQKMPLEIALISLLISLKQAFLGDFKDIGTLMQLPWNDFAIQHNLSGITPRDVTCN
jgi:hypothetical protein